MTSTFAEIEQKKRDLRSQIAGLDSQDIEKEATIEEWSPGRKMVKLWSMIDGTEIEIPRYQVGPALMKRITGTQQFAFTAHKDDAPTFRPGTVRCFLAVDSTERLSGLLAEAGLEHLPACPARELRSNYSKRVHAEHRHVQSWQILTEYVSDQEREASRSDQRKQTEAMISLAGSRVVEPREPRALRTAVVSNRTKVCAECGEEVPTAAFQYARHVKAHKAVVPTG
jgi:hypothetical protein